MKINDIILTVEEGLGDLYWDNAYMVQKTPEYDAIVREINNIMVDKQKPFQLSKYKHALYKVIITNTKLSTEDANELTTQMFNGIMHEQRINRIQ